MSEQFDPQQKPEYVENALERLSLIFDTAESALRLKITGREVAKEYLSEIYSILVELNKFDRSVVNPLEFWNPKGDLTEEEFNKLNRRRKILSNAIGIMTSSGKIRHDLNPDVPQSLD